MKIGEWGDHQRRWWGKWHLYLGLIAGLIVSVIGVTGSILVFQNEIDQRLYADFFATEPNGIYKDYGEIGVLLQKHHPELSIESLMRNEGSVHPTYRVLTNASRTEVFINPYTGEIIGSRPRYGRFMSVVMNLHSMLLVPIVGRYIVGASALVLLILSITGVRLWVRPKVRQLLSALTIKRSSSFAKKNHSWHTLLGLVSFPMVSMLSLSGCVMILNFLVLPLIFASAGRSPQVLISILAGKSTCSIVDPPPLLSSILKSVQQEEPKAQITAILFPKNAEATYFINARKTSKNKLDRIVLLSVDQYSGKILLNSEKEFPNLVHLYIDWVKPIHYSALGGLLIRIFAFVAGFMPLILTITGFFIWWPRYMRRPPKRKLPDLNAALPYINGRRYFISQLWKGFRYALWGLPLTFFSGMLYGLLAGFIWQPACLAVIFCACLATINLVIALIAFLFHIFILVPFKRGKHCILRYFAWSIPFGLVYFIVCFLFSIFLDY